MVAAGLPQRIQTLLGISRARQVVADDVARMRVDDDGGMHQILADLELGQVAGPHAVGDARLLQLQQVGSRRGAGPRPGAAVRAGRNRTQLSLDHQAPRQFAAALEPHALQLQGQSQGAHARLLAVQGHCCRQHPMVFRRRIARPVVVGAARQAYAGALGLHRPLVFWVDYHFALGRPSFPNAGEKIQFQLLPLELALELLDPLALLQRWRIRCCWPRSANCGCASMSWRVGCRSCAMRGNWGCERQRQRYTAQFKAKLMADLLEGKVGVGALAQQHGLSPGMLHRCRREEVQRIRQEAEREVKQQKRGDNPSDATAHQLQSLIAPPVQHAWRLLNHRMMACPLAKDALPGTCARTTWRPCGDRGVQVNVPALLIVIVAW